jgi:hypothetical protein
MGLSERERAILAFEGSWWMEPGTKDEQIRDRFGISPARYRQLLTALVDSPDAELADPLLVRRLRRDRDRRRRGRLGGGRGKGRTVR